MLGLSNRMGPSWLGDLASRFKLDVRPPLEGLADGAERLSEDCDVLLVDATSVAPPERRAFLERLLGELTRAARPVRAVVLVPDGDGEAARTAARYGAWDVVSQEDSAQLADRIAAAARLQSLDEGAGGLGRCEASGRHVHGSLGSTRMLGRSPAMRRAMRCIEQVAASDVPVLLTGASGTGKELAATLIHARSRRCGRPFVAINCAAIPENLLESELFGCERGAFTGATRSRRGRLEAAEGGTLFLDEVGELALRLQVKLLRFLQDHVVEPVGSSRRIALDVRVIAATNRNLEPTVEAGEFREDLYYRLAVLTLALPRLVERGEDVLLLARHFLERFGIELGRPALGFSEDAIEALRGADWPGNVRELINRVRRALVVADGREITAVDLGFASREPGPVISLREARRKGEAHCIERALRRHGGRKRETARALGISRTRLYELMRGYDILDGASSEPS
jgi:two-component system NtrC family response regulator